MDASAAARLEDAETLAAARLDALQERLERRLEENWVARSRGTARRLAALRHDKDRRKQQLSQCTVHSATALASAGLADDGGPAVCRPGLRKLKGCQASEVGASNPKIRSRRTRPSFSKGAPGTFPPTASHALTTP